MATATKTRKTISPAKREAAKIARQAKVDQMNAYMAEAEEKGIVESEQFENFSKSFERYSVRNQLLVLMQCPHATQVAGFKAWKDQGRVVRKGQKAIMIFGPASSKVVKDEETGEERTIKFPPPVVSVFDISQTDELVEA